MNPARNDTSSYSTSSYARAHALGNPPNQRLAALRQQGDRLDAAAHIAQNVTAATGSYAPISYVTQQRGTNMAMQDLYANRGHREAYSNEFLLDGHGRERLSPILVKRGIDAGMWNQDISELQAIRAGHHKRCVKDALLCLVTFGIYAVKDCFAEELVARLHRELDTKLDDMNARYEPYGVVFNRKSIPGIGSFIRYEA